MRKPTPKVELFAWWTAAIKWWPEPPKGRGPPIYMDDPQVGFFRRRLAKGGPWVPVAIWMDQPTDEDGNLCGDETLKAAVNGKLADPVEVWSWVADQPIPLAEYEHLVRTAKWAAEHAPSAPEASPEQPIDLLRVKPPSFERRAK